MAEIHVLFKFAPNPYGGIEIDTTSNSGKFRELSPFVLGPINVPGARAENFENLWQFSKVYRTHIDLNGEPTPEWFDWRAKGFADKYAHRYPMGKGSIPMYSWWNGEHLGYIEARKKIYAPIYAELVRKNNSFATLKQLYLDSAIIVLRDYDAYDHLKLGMTLVDVINNPDKKMGHAFVLSMMLTGVLDRCLEKQ
ncbi:hypothetical protein ES703_75475 [subsurface metagenome]